MRDKAGFLYPGRKWTPQQERAVALAAETGVLQHSVVSPTMEAWHRDWCEEYGLPFAKIVRTKHTSHVVVDFSTVGGFLDEEESRRVEEAFDRRAGRRSRCVVEAARITVASLSNAQAEAFTKEVLGIVRHERNEISRDKA